MITLKTLPQASEQEIFDQVAAHLLAQNKKSRSTISCLYLSPEGHKCAGGCLIGADEYDAGFEGLSWTELVYRGLVPPDHRGFITQLQLIHDARPTSEWTDNLRWFADQYGLKTGALA